MKLLYALAIVLGMSTSVAAQNLRLAVPEALDASGFAQFLVPRFSLKTGLRIDRVPEGAEAEMGFGTDGPPLFAGLGQQWSFAHDGDPRAQRFHDWLRSDVGRRTIESFTAPDGGVFSVHVETAAAPEATVYDGNAARGETVSLELCGRCHVINDSNRMKGLGSTPSFALLRTLPDWDTRFMQFFALNPHPAFTLIEDVSEPFDPARPSPIVPLRMSLDDLDAILAYVQGIAPADLGAPLHVQ